MSGGSSKKQTVGYKYYLGMHMVLCHGPVDFLTEIQVDDKIAWLGIEDGGQITIDEPDLFGGEKREGGIQGSVDIDMGESTQTPNTYLQSRLGSSIPAFRGVVSAVLRQVYLGMNPYLKPWAFRMQRIHLRQDGIEQWYDEKAEIFNFTRVVTQNENFNSGIGGYSTDGLLNPSYINNYSIVSDDFGNALRISVPAESGGYITKTFSQFLLTQCSIKFKLTSLAGSDDTSAFFIADRDGDRILQIHPRRESTVDPSRRCHINAYTGVGGDIISPSALSVNVWYRCEFDLNTDDLTYDVVLYKDDDNTVIGTLSGISNGEAKNFRAASINFNAEGPAGSILWDSVQLTGAYINGDMNPAHIIRECLTDPDWGMGYAEADIDSTSFTAAADTLYDEGMGISLLWDRQTSIESFITEIVRHIDGAIYVDRQTGKFVLKLIRDDYTLGSLITLDESNIAKVIDLSRPTFGELTNSVTVNYWDSQTGENASVSVQDTALVLMQNATINTTLQYPGFTSNELASRIALRDLKALSTPLWTCTLYTNQDAAALTIGDTFKFSWAEYGISEVVMRVTGIAYGDGKSNQIRLQATQDVFAIQTNSGVSAPDPDDGWTPLDTAPAAADVRLVTEAPYYELVTLLTQLTIDDKLTDEPDLGYVMAAAGRPDVEAALNALLYVDSGSGYVDADTLDFAPYAFLDADMDKSDISGTGTVTIAITGGVDLDQVTLGTHAQINSEMFRVDAVSDSSVTLGRGILDTVPGAHLQGDAILFWDEYPSSDEVEYVSSEIIDVKILTTTGAGILAEADAPEDTVTLGSRAIRPYPPGNLKINTSYFPETIGANADTALTWAHRDRLQQTSGTFNDFADTDIGPEASTTYTARIYGEDDDLIKTESAISGTSFTYDMADEITDSSIPISGGLTGDFPDFISALVPLAYWRMDEASGTTMADSSGNGYDGTYQNAPTLNQASLLNSGDGASVDYDGSSDYASINDPTDFSDLSALTIVMIVQPDNLSSRRKYIAKGVDVGGDRSKFSWEMTQDQTTGNVRLGFSDGSNYEQIYHSTLSVGTSNPHLLVYGYDSTNLLASIDGDTETQTRTTSGQHNETGALNLARENDNGGGGDYYDGSMAEVAIFDRLLTSSEIDDLYNAFANGPITGGEFRQNGRLRIVLESVRGGYTSFYQHDHEVRRPGYGFNYGYYYGNSA